MSLEGKTALVAGATGEVGRGAAFCLAQAGAAVTLLGRSATKLQAVQDSLPSSAPPSTVIAVDYSTVKGTQELAELLNGQTFSVVVCSSGPWWNLYTLSQADPETLHNAVAANFQAQLNLFSVLASKCTGQYLMVNGSAALGVPESGLTGVLARACVGASMLMNKECKENSAELPLYTHVLVQSSVGHVQFRSETHDPNEFGKVFVAMALGKHTTDEQGTTLVDDECYKELVSKLE